MKSYSEITLRYLKKNKKRTLFTIIGIILSLSLISGVGFLVLSFQEYMYDRAVSLYGDYEFQAYDVPKDKANILKNDVDIEKVGLAYKVGDFTPKNGSEITIAINGCDENYFKEIDSKNLVEGQYPSNNNEIVLNIAAKDNLKLNIGDAIVLQKLNIDEETATTTISEEKVNYKVTGFTNDYIYADSKYFKGKTYIETTNQTNEYDVYFSVISKKDKFEIAKNKVESIGLNSDFGKFEVNSGLLAAKGQTSYGRINIVITLMTIFVTAIIVLSTVFLIYNAINISVTERIGEFGILRSIGATPKQIRNLVFNEGLVMCLIAIPFGVIFGYLGVFITTSIMKNIISETLGYGSLKINFYPIVIIFTSVVGIITILLASFAPARKAGKVQVVDIIKGNLSGDKFKLRKARLIRTFFGVEGWIAYKNIRKNTKRFMVTIISLSISLIMFITFTILNMKRLDELKYMSKSSITDAKVYTNSHVNTEVIINDLKGINGIKDMYSISNCYVPTLGIDMNLLTDEYYGYLKEYNTIESMNNVLFGGFDDKALKAIGLDNGLQKNEIVLVNRMPAYNKDGKLENLDILKINEGDTVSIPVSNFAPLCESEDFEKLKEDRDSGNTIDFKVKKIIDKNPFMGGYNGNLQIIFSYDALKELYKGFDEKTFSDDINITFDHSGKSDINKASEEIEKICDEYRVSFNNLYEGNQREAQMWTVINVFIYGFIIMITLIGVVNVINTISLNILLKKKEFGTLGTIGMDNRQMSKMIILEGLLHGIISSIVGGVLALGLVLIAIKIMKNGFSFTNNLYWQPFVIGFIVNLFVVFIAALIPLAKLKKMSLVDQVRNIE